MSQDKDVELMTSISHSKAPKKVLITAGEVSGDRHAAALVRELKLLWPDSTFFGLGSTAMANEGVQLIDDITTSSTIGFVEPIKYVPKLFSAYRKVKKALREEKPDLYITIDFQGFHMLTLKAAKKYGIRTAYYIAPQEWQWGTEAGGRKVIAVCDKILAIFKEEEAFYEKLGGNVTFVGNPVADLSATLATDEAFYTRTGLNPEKPILAVFPGSRTQEIQRIFPVLWQSAATLKEKLPDYQIAISAASAHTKRLMTEKLTGATVPYTLYEGRSAELIARAHLSLTTSGTVTLEHAVLGTPCVVGYAVGPISFIVARAILKKKFDEKIHYFSLPNIYMQREVVPEFMQYGMTVENIYGAAYALLTDSARYNQVKAGLADVRRLLGDPGTAKRAAIALHNMFS